MESIVQSLIDFMKKGWTLFNNLRNLESDIESDMEILRSKTEMLNSREQDIMTEVEREEVHQGKKRKREVEKWQRNVKRLTNELPSIEAKVGDERGWTPRYKLRTLVAKKITEVDQLQEKGQFSDGVAIETLLCRSRPQPTATLLGESANKTLTEIWDYLMSAEVGKVGVYGMAGIGKTTIMKNVHNQLLNVHLFTSIIWVTVSKALDLRRLQHEIANAIGLELSNGYDGEEENISSKICAALSRRERCLLILDDLWEVFSLERIGIPEPNQTNCCKLVITTRFLKVCRGMESQRTVKVEVLSAEEAWHLFKEKVGGNVLDSSQIQPTAKLVLNECGRLPLAIITVGRALREVDDVSVWRNALNELKCSDTEIDGMDDYVFSRLMFSYNRLKNDTIRACFLYCALYPEDYNISKYYLIEKWIGEGLIKEVGDMEKEIEKGQTMLSELKDACMIEMGVYPDTVKLHDLLRDLAIIITRRSPRFMVKTEENLKESPKVEEWMEDMTRVSLMKNNIEVLSGQPMCHQLTTLLLRENRCLQQISNSFFEHIQSLRVLDVSETSIMSLPESISELENLRILKLDECEKLNKVPSIAKLKQLRVLNLDRTAIKELPQGIEELVNLRYLCLNDTKNFQIFPAGIICKFSLLERLFIRGSGWRWPSNIKKLRRAAAHIEEIGSLKRLTSLQLSFADVEGFINLVRSEKFLLLKEFSLTLGKIEIVIGAFIPVKGTVALGGGLDLVTHASSLILPCNTDSLSIMRCHDITHLSQLSCLANATQLKVCIVFGCNAMEFIAMAVEETLPRLEYLYLYSLPNLRALCHGTTLPLKTFANLKNLEVSDCDKMINLLSRGVLHCLQNLERIYVQSCRLMEYIVVDADGFSLPKLNNLKLIDLPELKSICNSAFTCNSLVSIELMKCPQLKKITFPGHNFSSALKEIKAEKEWWDALEWDDPNVKIHLQSRFIDITGDYSSIY